MIIGSDDESTVPTTEESLYPGATISTEAAWHAIIDFQVSHKLL